MKLRNFHWPPLALRIKMLTVAQAALTPVPGPAPAPRLHPSLPCPCRSGLELPSHTRLLTQGWHTYCSLCGNAMPILWVWLTPSHAQVSVAPPQKSLPIAPDPAVPGSSSCSLSIQFPFWFHACLSQQPDCGYPGPGAEWLL